MRKLLVIPFFFISILFLSAQNDLALKTVAPEKAGFSSSKLQKLTKAMNEWSEKRHMNGGVGLIIHNGQIVYYNAAGYNDIDKKEPLKKDAIFRIASQTKAITSVAIMMLYDEGKILLTDPVSKFISTYKKQTVLDKFNAKDTTYTTVAASREITIKDLLTHTSGIGYAQIGSPEANAIYEKNHLTAGLAVNNESLLAAMTRLGSLPLMHQPGKQWTYGLNTDLLGSIVEVVSGMSLDDFFRTRIFEPLGMKDTYFVIPEQKRSRLANLYGDDDKGKLVMAKGNLLNGEAAADFPIKSTKYFSGGAGLSSTILDYGIFLQMLLNGGSYNGKRILGRNTVRMMTMNQIGDLPFGDNKFGLGFSILTEKGSADVPAQQGTFAWGGAFATSYWVDPREKLVLLFYRQLFPTNHWDVVEKFRALAYQALND